MLKKGELRYRDIEFDFILENSELNLQVKNNYENEFKNIFYKNLGNGSYTTRDVYFEEGYLIGKNKENFGTMIMIINKKQFLHNFINNNLSIEVDSVFELYRNTNISRISLYAKEMDYIYNIEKAIKERKFNYNNGEINILINSIKETESKDIKFQLDGKEIRCSFSISRIMHGGINSYPIQIKSDFSAYFEPTSDYIFILKIYRIIEQFIQFLCFRRNINIEEVHVHNKNEKEFYEKIGTIELFENKVDEEEQKIIERRYIPFNLIQDNVENIFQELANDSLYMRHLPDSYIKGKSENEASFVILVAAFEWEFKQLFKDGLPHSEKTKEAQKKVKENIENIINKKDIKGKEKKIYKSLLNFIELEALSEKIVYTCEYLNDIINQFGKELFELNGEILNYKEMGKRLNEQRNHFAHGDLDKEFIGKSLLDLIFLKEVVYAMQLKRLGISDDNIKKCINRLFYGRI